MTTTYSKSPQDLKILFIGSNPSISSGYAGHAFFLDTKSGRELATWITRLENFLAKERYCVAFANVSNTPTDNNRPLKVSEIKEALPNLARTIERFQPSHIIALGKTAHKALTLLQLDHLEMPHPSGLNRKLNDKEYKEQKIKELVDYCKPTSPEE